MLRKVRVEGVVGYRVVADELQLPKELDDIDSAGVLACVDVSQGESWCCIKRLLITRLTPTISLTLMMSNDDAIPYRPCLVSTSQISSPLFTHRTW